MTDTAHVLRVHRRLLRGHFSYGRQRLRVMKALALLVESGTIYCILLVSPVDRVCSCILCSRSRGSHTGNGGYGQVIVVIFQASPALLPMPDVHQNAFLRAVADYTYACFTPVIVSTSTSTREVCACVPIELTPMAGHISSAHHRHRRTQLVPH